MKKLLLLFGITLCFFSFTKAQTVILNETFNNSTMPAGWGGTGAYSAGGGNVWMALHGSEWGASLVVPKGGSYLAGLWDGGFTSCRTYLVSPVLNLQTYGPATLKFYYLGYSYFGNPFFDSLYVAYRIGKNGAVHNIPIIGYIETATNSNQKMDSATLTVPGGSDSTYVMFLGAYNQDYGVYLSCVTVTATLTGINEVTNTNKLNIYPNPARNMVYVQLNGSDKAKTLSLYSMLGQKVWEGNGTGVNTEEIPVSNLPQGIYFVQTQLQDGTILTGKIEVSK
jgi:hypothetical protein